ncbi:unnamed protein product, partial [Rotaria magnacalcarata]
MLSVVGNWFLGIVDRSGAAVGINNSSNKIG